MQNATFKAEKVVPASKMPNFLASIVLKIQLFQGKGTEPFTFGRKCTSTAQQSSSPTALNFKKLFQGKVRRVF